MPEGVDAYAHSELLLAAFPKLHQSGVRLLRDPATQRAGVLLEPRLAVAAHLLGPNVALRAVQLPEALHALAADPEALAHLARAFPGFARRDNPAPKILTQGSHRLCSSMHNTMGRHTGQR